MHPAGEQRQIRCNSFHLVTLKRFVPPHHLLQALLATARFGSMARAATHLDLTASAVSKQVLELEHLLGVALFERIRKQLRLTPAGQRYVARIEPLISELEEATKSVVVGAAQGTTLGISSVPSFGDKHVVPHLREFSERHPDIELRFVPYVRSYDFSVPELDCAIRFGEGSWPGARAHYLAGSHNVVIAPSKRAHGSPPLAKPADVLHYPLLRHLSVPNAWRDWCRVHGVDDAKSLSGPCLDMCSTIVQAVASGMGLGLLPACIVHQDLDAGVVHSPLPVWRIMPWGYYLCYPEEKAGLPALVAFRDWLLERCGALEPDAGSRPLHSTGN
ncbi:LysR substrate-binding domain-containing protein [Variovorax sp. dw_308]|uniref:LysR substrate-binding domain-containing protein n=1 Tax=Variovorax sp. dw_308 TaxID=2721546 RepID=UPI00352892B4